MNPERFPVSQFESSVDAVITGQQGRVVVYYGGNI